jgi:hypothetical protein
MVPCPLAGMIADADSTDDMDPLRHSATDELPPGSGRPSTMRSFLRPFTWDNIRHPDRAPMRRWRAGELANPCGADVRPDRNARGAL